MRLSGKRIDDGPPPVELVDGKDARFFAMTENDLTLIVHPSVRDRLRRFDEVSFKDNLYIVAGVGRRTLTLVG